MKKTLFFCLAVFLFYFAAVYQYSALMVLAVGQLLLLLFLTVHTYICRNRLRIAFAQKKVTVVKGEEHFCEIAIDCHGKLPGGCIKFYLIQGYGCMQEKVRLYGNSNNGKAVFAVKAQHCGIKNIGLKKARIYDCLLLGSLKKAISDQMQIMVFPKEQVLDIWISDAEKDEYPKENQQVKTMRDVGEEVCQIREYREGDSKRQFHWKLSARMDSMLVKEYETETKNITELVLDLSDYYVASMQQRDAFYTLLSALLFGLLREQEQVNVCWQEDGENNIVRIEVTVPSQCREVLMRLYCLGGEWENKREGSKQGRRVMSRQLREIINEESLVLDMGLFLSQGTRQLYQFSRVHLEEEIQEKQIVVVRGV